MGYENLDQSVISDLEAQFSGDVEAPFFEMPYIAGVPPVATDKQTSRQWTGTDGKTRIRDAGGAILNMTDGAVAGSAARELVEDYQGAAATKTSRVFRALKAGTIAEFGVFVEGALAAAGESMTVDIQINAVSALTAVITLNDTVPGALNTLVAGVMDTANNAFVAGDLIEIVRTYVAGGGPTPLLDTYVEVGIKSA